MKKMRPQIPGAFLSRTEEGPAEGRKSTRKAAAQGEKRSMPAAAKRLPEPAASHVLPQSKTAPKVRSQADEPQSKAAPKVRSQADAPQSKTTPKVRSQAGPLSTIAVPPSCSPSPGAREKGGDEALFHFPSKEKLLAVWKTIRENRRSRRLLYFSLVFLAFLLFLLLPLFRIQDIYPAERLFFTPWEKILDASGLYVQQHFLNGYGSSLDALITGRYSKAESAVREACPALKRVDIRYHFPGRIVFDIEERIPVAYMDIRDSYITLDRYGVVVSSTREIPRGLPVIRGIDAMQMKVGEALLSNADEKLKSCIDVMSAIVEADFENQSQNPILPRVREIRAFSSRIVLELMPLGEGKILTVSCSAKRNLKDDFLWLAKVLESGNLDDKLPGNLDIYGSQLVFRPENAGKGGNYVWQDEIWLPEAEAAGEELAQEEILQDETELAETEENSEDLLEEELP